VDKEGALGNASERSLSIFSERSCPCCTVHRPGTSDVHRNESALPRGPRAQGVEPDSSLLVAREDLRDGFLVFGRKGPIEQTLRGITQQPDARPHDVRGDDERDQGGLAPAIR
jgi:hypothetical protein